MKENVMSTSGLVDYLESEELKEELRRIQFRSNIKDEILRLMELYERYVDRYGQLFIEDKIKSIAKNLLDKGVAIDIITSSTGLSEKEIQEL